MPLKLEYKEALPEGPPELHTDRERYDPGDILRANCTSPPSKPAASITFLLNDVPVRQALISVGMGLRRE
uniref:Uncharacterized protein n=1 Tax=Timema cristinae TaxID=61476 RepID=A0A7R9GUP1_TIMCR|nr:unnamed protein product [Timema cristinae]